VRGPPGLPAARGVEAEGFEAQSWVSLELACRVHGTLNSAKEAHCRGRGGPADGFEVAISPRTEKLVVAGPYRYSRNPMVYGVFSAYFAIAFLRGSLGDLVVLAVIVPLFVSYLKRVEERRLLRDFGEEYEQYRREVSMIVPLPPKR
jgi:hypothetical protein